MAASEGNVDAVALSRDNDVDNTRIRLERVVGIRLMLDIGLKHCTFHFNIASVIYMQRFAQIGIPFFPGDKRFDMAKFSLVSYTPNIENYSPPLFWPPSRSVEENAFSSGSLFSRNE